MDPKPPPILTLDNVSTHPYIGWHRATTDAYAGLPESGYFAIEGRDWRVAYVLGEPVAEGARAIDIYSTIDPGQSLRIRMESIPGEKLRSGRVIDFGGHPVVLTASSRFEMSVVGNLEVNGAAFEATWRADCGDGFWVYLETRYYPGQSWVEAELSVYQSGRHADLRKFLETLSIVWGDSAAWRVGNGLDHGGAVIRNTWFTDGQMRVIPMVFLWGSDYPMALAKMDGGIVSWGIQKLLPDGQPRQGTPDAVRQWARRHIWDVKPRLHTWDGIPLGVAPRGPNTGDQEDQVFVGAEGSVWGPASILRYMTALKFGNRPCHHLDTDGSILRGDRHPGLRFWGMRPDPRFTSNLLGKPRTLGDGEAEGGWGNAGPSHWLINTLAAANRTTGSPTVQRLLRHQAENYLLERTVNPGWTTSIIWQSRDVAWECLAVLHLLREVTDAGLRQRVLERFIARWESVIRPYLQASEIGRRGVWHVLVDDLRVGTGEWWHPWMQAVGAYGLWVLGRYLGSYAPIGTEMVAHAVSAASTVVEAAYPGDRLDPLDSVALDGRVIDRGTFSDAWTPLAAAVLFMHQGHEKSRQICQQWADRLEGKADQSWFPPGLDEKLHPRA